MKIDVSGKGIKVGASLQEYVEDRLSKAVTKYFDHAIHGHVVFSHEGEYLYRADIHVNEGTGTRELIKAFATSDDIYAAFDMSLVKIEKQLRRYKTKIKSHHKKKLSEVIGEESFKATKYVISSKSFAEEDEESNDNPLIIAEKPTDIQKLSVSEAVMKMDLASLPALLFINSATGRLNVVYHRADGNISWVDPENFA
jgi:ribosomal subunit interface protein